MAQIERIRVWHKSMDNGIINNKFVDLLHQKSYSRDNVAYMKSRYGMIEDVVYQLLEAPLKGTYRANGLWQSTIFNQVKSNAMSILKGLIDTSKTPQKQAEELVELEQLVHKTLLNAAEFKGRLQN